MTAYLAPQRFTVTGLGGLPEVGAGADLAGLLLDAAARAGTALRNDDVVVVAQKIVSKAEGRRVRLAEITPSTRAQELAAVTGKDPRLVELVLREAREVLRVGREVIVVEDVRGLVLANAGVDQSNLPDSREETEALLLPADPDDSARRLRADLAGHGGVECAVIIADSLGRAWRLGTLGHAIGAAGLPALVDLRGRTDRGGRTLRHTEIALADTLAAAGVLAMGEAGEGRPAAVIRGLTGLAAAAGSSGAAPAGDLGARALQRARQLDLFR